MTTSRKILEYAALLYILAFPVCSGISSLPIRVAAILYIAYPLWFAIWLVAVFLVLRRLGKRYGETKMGMWWWLSVPYSVALPALSLILGLGSWGAAHMLGLFMLVAYLTVPSSLAWAVVALAQHPWSRKGTNDKVMLGFIPLMMLLWAVLLTVR